MTSAKAIRVNQIAYWSGGPKVATLVDDAKTPVSWRLIDQHGQICVSAMSKVFGHDKASGLHVHHLDFSSFTGTGQGFKLDYGSSSDRAGTHAPRGDSHPFAILENPWSSINDEVFRYFYLNRSGEAITMPRAGSPDQCRAPGHRPDIAALPPELGGGSLDVSGGWYDAGDHGKYVVNGGIALWTLQFLVEGWPLWFGEPMEPQRQTLIMDECAFEMDFLLRMQIPDSLAHAGMAFHKVNDESWTGIPQNPATDPRQRKLYGPSTAATLNLAAVAAQGSRIWSQTRPAYAAKLLAAAEKAWQAARQNPVMLFTPEQDQGGGGAYADSHIDDEWYWAACELYLASGKQVYRELLAASVYSCKAGTLGLGEVSDPLRMAFDWQTTNTLGTLSLSISTSGPLGAGSAQSSSSLADRAGIHSHSEYHDDAQTHATFLAKSRASIAEAAALYHEQVKSEGFLTPLIPQAYPWGSNSFVLNKMIVMAVAGDLHGAILSFDYILGRNCLDLCYISGFGSRPIRYPHHRYWAAAIDSAYPAAPAGCLAGGPNSEVIDPVGIDLGFEGRAPQACYVDNIASYASNEVAINWNAPLFFILEWFRARFNHV